MESNWKKQKDAMNSETNASLNNSYKKNDATDILNNDCLINIFNFLPISDRVRMERVCKRWRAASQMSWHYLKELNCSKECWGPDSKEVVNKRVLKKVLQRCGKFIIRLDLSTRRELPGVDSIEVLLSMCPNLQSVDLRSFRIGIPQLRMLANFCPKITELILGRTTYYCGDQKLKEFIFANYKNLRIFKISNSHCVRAYCLESLSSEFIEEISFEYCSRLRFEPLFNTIQTFQKLRTLSLRNSLEPCAITSLQNCLHKLNIKTLDISRNSREIVDSVLINLASACSTLSSINLSYNDEVTDLGLISITELPNIKHLFIDCLTKVTDQVLMDMPNLRTMSCRKCKYVRDSGLMQLLIMSDNIELLNLTKCERISKKLIYTAVNVAKCRTNGITLKIILSGTELNDAEVPKNSPSLKLVF